MRATNKLAPKRVATIKHPGRYGDGGGLWLQVSKTGKHVTKAWLFRFMLNGRARQMGLGSINTFSLAEARERAKKARQLVADGIDPIEARLAERDLSRKQQAERLTFREVAERYIELHEAGWRNEKHRAQWRSSLEQYAFPKLGPRPVKALDAAVINDAIAPIWARIPDTAKRTRGRIHSVVKWVKDGMPLPATVTAENGSEKQPALPYEQIPEFLRELRRREGIAARALEFQILTASRPGAVATAPWKEIDPKHGVWTVSASRPGTKLRARDHRVPLCDRALEILELLPREKNNPHIFIGRTGKSLSDMALLQTIRRMNEERKKAGLSAFVDTKQGGREIVPHGFRSTFRDWAADRTSYPNHVIEMALAHTIENKVEAAYRRGDLFEKRKRLMETWGSYCAEKPRPAAYNVTPLQRVGA